MKRENPIDCMFWFCLFFGFLMVVPTDSLGKRKHKNTSVWGAAKTKPTHWEVSGGFGFSYFTGSLNMYSGDRFTNYNVTDSKPGVNFNFHYRFNISNTFFADFDFNTSTLSGDATHIFLNSEDNQWYAGLTNPYKTSVVRLVPMIGVDLLNLFTYYPYYRDFTLKARGGIGLSYTNVKENPFPQESRPEGENVIYPTYDFGDKLPTDLVGVIGFEIRKMIDSKLTFSCLFDYNFVAGSRIDAYYIGQDPISGGIPGPENGDPLLLDTYINMSFGLAYRIGGSKAKKIPPYLRERRGKKRRVRYWYE